MTSARTRMTQRFLVLAAVMSASIVVGGNGTHVAAAGGMEATCAVKTSDVVVPPGGQASIIITVSYDVTKVQTVYVAMEPVAGYMFTSGRFLAWPAGAKTSTGNLTVTDIDPGASSVRTAVLVDESPCALVTLWTGSVTSTTSSSPPTSSSSSSTTTKTDSASVPVEESISTLTRTATVTVTTTDAPPSTSFSSSNGSPPFAKAAISQEPRQLRSALSVFSSLLFFEVAAGASIAATAGIAVWYCAKRRSSKRAGKPPAVTLK